MGILCEGNYYTECWEYILISSGMLVCSVLIENTANELLMTYLIFIPGWLEGGQICFLGGGGAIVYHYPSLVSNRHTICIVKV